MCWILCSQCVLMNFSACSRSSQCVPQHAPNSSSHYPIILCQKLYSFVMKQPKGGDYNISIFGAVQRLDFFVSFVMGQSKLPITEEKKLSFRGAHTSLV